MKKGYYEQTEIGERNRKMKKRLEREERNKGKKLYIEDLNLASGIALFLSVFSFMFYLMTINENMEENLAFLVGSVFMLLMASFLYFLKWIIKKRM